MTTPPSGRKGVGASISLRGVKKAYGGFVAVADVGLDVRPGEFLSLLGASGSGKSTLLRLIAGLDQPTAGQIMIGGVDATRLPPEARGIGMVFQDYALFPNMTVAQNISFPLRLRGMRGPEMEKRLGEAMSLVGIDGFATRRPNQLSGGQQQRVALARALVYEPGVLLLDEPLSALDKQLREQMKGEIKRLHRQLGVTIIYVTHDQSEALALSDRVAVMERGRMIDVDEPTRLYDLPASPYLASFIGDANLIPGKVRAIDDRVVTVDGAIGSFAVPIERCRVPSALQIGDHVTIVARPENLRLGLAAEHGVEGQLQEALYNGADTIFTIAVQGAPALIARSSSAELRSLPIGDRIMVSATAESLVIVEPES